MSKSSAKAVAAEFVSPMPVPVNESQYALAAALARRNLSCLRVVFAGSRWILIGIAPFLPLCCLICCRSLLRLFACSVLQFTKHSPASSTSFLSRIRPLKIRTRSRRIIISVAPEATGFYNCCSDGIRRSVLHSCACAGWCGALVFASERVADAVFLFLFAFGFILEQDRESLRSHVWIRWCAARMG
jgi:hypothetical protein